MMRTLRSVPRKDILIISNNKSGEYTLVNSELNRVTRSEGLTNIVVCKYIQSAMRLKDLSANVLTLNDGPLGDQGRKGKSQGVPIAFKKVS